MLNLLNYSNRNHYGGVKRATLRIEQTLLGSIKKIKQCERSKCKRFRPEEATFSIPKANTLGKNSVCEIIHFEEYRKWVKPGLHTFLFLLFRCRIDYVGI